MTNFSDDADNSIQTKPAVLCFSGHDPSGGAGIQADIEAITAQGVQAMTVVTALTCQDTRHVKSFQSVDALQLSRQAETLLNDMPVHAFKIGMTADVSVVKAIHSIIKKHEEIPVIFDPVLASGGGDLLATRELINAIDIYLLPYCHLITPNIPEALKLLDGSEADEKNVTTAASFLLNAGCEHVLITGTHSQSEEIEHQLYHAHEAMQTFKNKRLPHEYHGSGCTLASSIAAFIARGEETNQAIKLGLDYTFASLQHAQAPGHGQYLPDRLYQLNK